MNKQRFSRQDKMQPRTGRALENHPRTHLSHDGWNHNDATAL